MEHQPQRMSPPQPTRLQPGPPPAVHHPSDGMRKLASEIGNRAFAHAVVARDAGTTPVQQQTTPSWSVPDWGLATQTLQARSACWHIDSEARSLEGAGFDRFGILAEEARSWGSALAGEMRPLTVNEARQLTQFSEEFRGERDKAIRILADSLVRQLSS